MAKVNPVMQHAPVKKTAEQIALEDFLNTVPPALVKEGDIMIDNAPAEWIEVEDTSLEPIVDSVAVADTLDDLADDVDASTTAIAMESYRRLFTQVTELTGHPIQPGVSLESFKLTKGGKKKLSTSIREHAATIRSCVNIALEDYVDSVDEKVANTIANYKQVIGDLNRLETSIDVPDTPIQIDHKQIWDMFFINDEAIDPTEIGLEVSAVKELAEIVSKGVSNLKTMSSGGAEGAALGGSEFVQLMYNTDVKISNGRAKFEKQPTPKPSKEMAGKDWGWLVFWGILGGPVGLITAAIYRGIAGGNGKEKTKKEQSKAQMQNMIRAIKGMSSVVTKLDQEVDTILKLVEAAPEENKASLKRAASPVLELASKTIAHVTEVSYGAKVLFSKLG